MSRFNNNEVVFLTTFFMKEIYPIVLQFDRCDVALLLENSFLLPTCKII
jgi:hypothetical protein